MSVIVDDRDPQVQYTGSWFSQGEGRALEYNSTTIFGEKPGDTAEFTFEGTSVTVHGTVTQGSAAAMSFHIDQSTDSVFSAPASSSALHHQVLWTSDILPEGTHTLFITQQTDSMTNGAQRIQLDYLLYNTTSTAGKTLFIDDGDARVKYSPGWQETISESVFQGKAHISSVAGSSVSFSFQGGEFVSFHGPITFGPGGDALNATVAIDGAPAVSILQNHPSLAGSIPLNGQIFKTGLSPGPQPHTVVITVLDDTPFYVDYILLGSTSDTGASATSIPAQASPIVPQAASSQSSNPNVAAIVGGVVGGLALPLLLLLGALLWRRTRRQRSRRLDHPGPGLIQASPSSRWM